MMLYIQEEIEKRLLYSPQTDNNVRVAHKAMLLLLPRGDGRHEAIDKGRRIARINPLSDRGTYHVGRHTGSWGKGETRRDRDSR